MPLKIEYGIFSLEQVLDEWRAIADGIEMRNVVQGYCSLFLEDVPVIFVEGMS